MDNTNYKKKGIGLFILFVLAFALIMFLPNIRQSIMEKQYEKENEASIDKKQEEVEQKEKHEKVSNVICSLDNDSYSFSYKSSGLQKYSKTDNGSFVKIISYDFTAMSEQYRKDNIFEFKYSDSVETIKSDLEKKGYTCG